MAGNRSAAQAVILTYIRKMFPQEPKDKPGNYQMYEKIFAAMNDKDFDALMDDLESGKRHLYVVVPNFSENTMVPERNLEIADELGYDFFQRLHIEGVDGEPDYLTPNKYMVVDLPVRRASQMLIKKISVPKHNKVIDALTGQPTGESKGAKISYPELQVCAAMGLDNCMVELMKYRGGDVAGNNALSGMVSKYGTANLKTLAPYASGVESTKTLKTFLTACHLKSNL